MLEAAFITQLDAAVCFGGVFIPAHHTAKPESSLERNPTPQPQHLTKREEGTLFETPHAPVSAPPTRDAHALPGSCGAPSSAAALYDAVQLALERMVKKPRAGSCPRIAARSCIASAKRLFQSIG